VRSPEPFRSAKDGRRFQDSGVSARNQTGPPRCKFKVPCAECCHSRTVYLRPAVEATVYAVRRKRGLHALTMRPCLHPDSPINKLPTKFEPRRTRARSKAPETSSKHRNCKVGNLILRIAKQMQRCAITTLLDTFFHHFSKSTVGGNGTDTRFASNVIYPPRRSAGDQL